MDFNFFIGIFSYLRDIISINHLVICRDTNKDCINNIDEMEEVKIAD